MLRGYFKGCSRPAPWVAALVLLLAPLGAVCCSDSEPEAVTTPDDADAGLQGTPCDPGGPGACQNASDCPRVDDGQARTSSRSCQVSCAPSSDGLPSNEEDDPSCQRDCLVLGTGISVGCASCYVAQVACSLERCNNVCLADADGQGCRDCQAQQGCLTEFTACSGASFGL